MKVNIHIEINSASKFDSNNLKFIPEEAKVCWNNLEIQPVFEDKNGFCDVVEEGMETFWSVYIHQVDGGARCVADVPTKNDAIKLSELIHLLSLTRCK